MASASEKPDVSTQLMKKVNVTIMDTIAYGENSVDKKHQIKDENELMILRITCQI